MIDDVCDLYKSILQGGERYQQKLRDDIQVRVAELSLEVSRRAIQQSKEVSLLTKLAFVFIPVTFTKGIFGMNVEPFGGEAKGAILDDHTLY